MCANNAGMACAAPADTMVSVPSHSRLGRSSADLGVARDDMKIVLIDLRDYPMPFFDEPASNAWVPFQGTSTS